MADSLRFLADKKRRGTRVFVCFAVFVFSAILLFSVPQTIKKAQACLPGTADCDCNLATGCETNTLSDPANCGACGKVCESGVCNNGSCSNIQPDLTGGVVPCGRLMDNPATPYDEREPCNLCHVFIMLQIIGAFIFQIGSYAAVFFIVVGGVIYATSIGNESRMEWGKKSAIYAIMGYAIIILAWLIVTISLTSMGYIDPLGGKWNMINCDLKPGNAVGPQVYTYCGDGHVDVPNSAGLNEQCEQSESYADFQTRTGGTQQQWVETIYRCKPDCTLGCVGNPNLGKIGEGCYLDLNGNGIVDTNECQKGKYVCDFSSGNVVCADVFGDPKYKGMPQYKACPELDFCCSTNGSTTAAQKAAAATLSKFAPVRLDPACVGQYPNPYFASRAATQTYIDAHGLGNKYSPVTILGTSWFMGCRAQTCDEVCKTQGKTCVGIGEYGSMNCIFSAHDVGFGLCPGKYGCDWNTNGLTGNCKATDSQLNYPGSVACVDPGQYAANGNSCAGLSDIWIGSTWCYCK